MPLKNYMCLYPTKLKKSGQYKNDTYLGKKGDFYAIETFSKCGRCEQCIAEKANNWVIRNNYESKGHNKICFITLTYEKTLPFLIKKDFQDWIKRFRRYIEYHGLIDIIEYQYKINYLTGVMKKIPIYDKVRYFGAGEYGTLHHRPHGHFIIYNWEEKKENLTYLGINEKGNIILQSKTIQETWGLGRTTYQIFDTHEIPYISLYTTPREETFKGYIFSRKDYKKLKDKYWKLIEEDKKKRKEIKSLYDKDKFNKEYYILLNQITKNLERYKELVNQLEEHEKLLKKTKEKSILITEFNMWSIAIGWEEFVKNYNKYKDLYEWKEYIEDKEFYTCTPWVKKLANQGDQHAIKEMLRRAELTAELETEIELSNKNRKRVLDKTKDNIIEWVTKKETTIL